MPLANRLLRHNQLLDPEPLFPLDLGFCAACSLVQIKETIPPETLFRDYVYFSSYSETMLHSSEALARRLAHERSLDAHKLVVEVASNDGYLLQYYQRLGVQVLGIEPAVNVARVAEARGIPTVVEFFDDKLAETLISAGRRADVLHANNVLAHVADLNGFVRGIALLLQDVGVAVIEVPYVRDLVDHAEFDTIYHEHLCYFSLTALTGLFRRHGLTIQNVERLPIHGGSLRLFVGQADHQSETVHDVLDQERGLGIERLDFYRNLSARAERVKANLVRLLDDLKQRGLRVAAYGAAAKGATLLNYCAIGADTIEFVVDRSRHKQGLYMPGAHLPIVASDRLLQSQPEYLLILAWNLADEIIAQQATYRARGGQFILPVPEVRIIE
jgi:hypothetical protein